MFDDDAVCYWWMCLSWRDKGREQHHNSFCALDICAERNLKTKAVIQQQPLRTELFFEAFLSFEGFSPFPMNIWHAVPSSVVRSDFLQPGASRLSHGLSFEGRRCATITVDRRRLLSLLQPSRFPHTERPHAHSAAPPSTSRHPNSRVQKGRQLCSPASIAGAPAVSCICMCHVTRMLFTTFARIAVGRAGGNQHQRATQLHI